jgi:transcriptional regulator GlxA family with amidase domain
MRVALVAFDDFTDIDLHLAWDLFSRVPDLAVRIVAAAPRIRSSTGLGLDVHGGLDEVAGADAVYITSGKGTRAAVRDPAFLTALAVDPARQIIAAVDSGAIILAALGLLRGKRATTYPSPDLHAALAGFGAIHVDEALVVEGNLATAAQCLAGVDLVAWVVTRLVGAEAAAAAVASVRRLGA